MKTNPIVKMMKTSLLNLPSPSSISFMWNMGFILGMILMLQLTTGIILSMLYSPNNSEAFQNMVKIMQDYKTSWVTQNIHSNGASLFFILLYMHTARGLFFNSPPNHPKVWMSGMLLMLLTMMTAFLGYVLPWGQMSFWGATVITGVLSAIPIIGSELMVWIWGGPSISQPTLNRFFSLHFLIPLLITALVMIHLILLHEKGSSNPSTLLQSTDKLKFHSMFTIKDSLPTLMISVLFLYLLSMNPNLLGDVENFNPANPLIAPIHIQPEWYFLFAYVILRSIPSKLGGVIALIMSIMILLTPVLQKSNPAKFSPTKKMKLWTLIAIMIVLTWIGAKPVESPYEGIGQIFTTLYFSTILVL